MKKTQEKHTVESIIVKYRNYVIEHCPKICDASEWQDEKGEWHFDEIETPASPESNADEQLLVTLYCAVAGKDADSRVVDALSKYADAYLTNALSENEFKYLCENFSDVVSYEFTHRDNWTWTFNDGCHVSAERIRLVKENVETMKYANVFIADVEYGDIAVMFPDCIIHGFTGYKYMEKEVWALGQIRLFAAGIKSEIDHGKVNDDKYTYTLPAKGSMDLVIFRANGNKSSLFGTECNNIPELYNLVKPGGKMLFFVELMEEMAGKDGSYLFRKKIVDDKNIASIVEYEEENFMGCVEEGTHLLLILERKDNEEVFFKDERTNEAFSIKSESLHSDLLWPSYYRTKHPQIGIPLSELVSIINYDLASFEPVKKDGKLVLPESMKQKLVVVPSKMAKDYKDADLLSRNLDHANADFDIRKLWHMRSITKPCVLLRGKKGQFVAGYIDKLPNSDIISSTSIVYLEPKNNIDIRYITALLLSPEVKEQIMSICWGEVNNSTFPLIIDKIIVPDHSEKERLKFLSEANYTALLSIQEELKQEHQNYTKAVRMRKHALTQSLSSIEAMFYALNKYRSQTNGNLTDEDVISRVQGITVKDAFEFLSKEITDMMPVLEHITDVEYSFSKPESIDPEGFIEDYVNKEKKSWLNFKPVFTWEKDNNKAKHNLQNINGDVVCRKGTPLNTLVFPKDALIKVFNNILSNATSYAFTDDSRKDYQLRFSWYADDDSLIVEIDNNGTPIPEDRDTASLLEYGVSTALHKDGHNGIGCNEIKDIMSRYNGDVEIVSSPKDEFTVKYILTFYNANTNLFKLQYNG